MPDMQNVALGNHPIQIPSGNQDTAVTSLTLTRHRRVPRHPEAVHQGGHPHPAPGPPALVSCVLPLHGAG